jgi:hypothetical protein
MMRKSAFVFSVALFAAAACATGEPVRKPPAGPTVTVAAAASNVVSLTCNPFYLPARSIWPRKVAIEVDADGVRSVEIDGVAVYTFNVNGTVILTAVDGERIQIDINTLTWNSDLRGLVTGRGGCTR